MFPLLFTLLYILTIIIFIFLYNKKVKSMQQFVKEATALSRKNKLVDKKNKIVKKILELTTQKDIELEASAKAILKVLIEQFEIQYCTIFINKGRLITLASNVEGEYRKEIEDLCEENLKKMKYGAVIECSNNYLEYASAEKRKIRYFNFTPLKRDQVIGAILIEDNSENQKQEMEGEFFTLLIDSISLVLQTFIYKEQITSISMLDNMTQAYNHNYMQAYLEKQVSSPQLFSLAMIDIDHLKNYNDTYGAEIGDLILKEVSKLIKESIRELDVLFRGRGDEFIIYFYDFDSEKAFTVVDTLREAISRLKIRNSFGVEVNATVSFGIVEYPKQAREIKKMVQSLETAIRESKAQGINRGSIYNGREN